MKKTIIIVGGGITGLTTAYYAQKEIERLDLPYKVRLIEASDRLGGKIHTVHKDGFVLERGADSFLERKTAAVDLVEELGISDTFVRNSTGQAHVLVGEALHRIPGGSFMGIPVQKDSLTDEKIISEAGKKRVQEELTLPKGEATDDQSLGQFLRGRFGDELIENLVEPLLSGIYSSDIDEMSIMASFPQFYELEQKYGSVIRGLRETLPANRASTGKKKGQFLSFGDGLGTLVDALYEAIGKETVLFETAVEEITKQGDGYELELSDGKTCEADAVVMTVPHKHLPRMFPEETLFEPFTQMPMSSVANVICAFDESAIGQIIDGTGFVVSRNSDFRMTACTWTHRKWPSTTPEGKVLLRAYVGKPSDQEVVKLSDKEITDIVLGELETTMNITEKPLFALVSRWQEMMPQYRIGHVETVKRVREELTKKLPGIYLSGSSYEGVGIPDCVKQGKEAAEKVVKFLREEN